MTIVILILQLLPTKHMNFTHKFFCTMAPTFTLALEVDVVCLFMRLSVCLNRYENHHPLRVGEKRNRHVRFNKTIVCNCDSWDRVFYYLVYSDRNEPKVSGFVRFHSAGILSTRGTGRDLLQWLLYSLQLLLIKHVSLPTTTLETMMIMTMMINRKQGRKD